LLESYFTIRGYYILYDGYFIRTYTKDTDSPKTISVLYQSSTISTNHLQPIIEST